jgi:hypothetical protein
MQYKTNRKGSWSFKLKRQKDFALPVFKFVFFVVCGWKKQKQSLYKTIVKYMIYCISVYINDV